MVRLGSINTGLPPNIVEQLMEAEKIPIRNMETKKSNQQAKLDLVTELETKLNSIKSGIEGLASARGFTDIKLESGDPNIVTGVVDPNRSVSGNWNIEVLELAQKAAAITNGFPDKDRTEIGVGYFTFDTPEGSKEVYIDGENSTLDGAANAINRAGLGVRATVLNDRSDPDRPYKLVISGDNVGGDNSIEYPTLYFLDGDQDVYFDEQREARNGRVKVDGFEFQVNDNKVEDVIPGVTLDLRQAAPGRQVNINVKEDREVVSGKVKDFVGTMNEVLSFIQAQNNLNADSDTTRTLGGDSLLRSIENRIRRLIQDPVYGISGPINRIQQLGIEFGRDGTLKFEQERFDSTLSTNPEAVSAFLAGDGFETGFIPKMNREIGNLMNGVFGPVSVRKRALQDKIRQIDDRISNKERMLEGKEKSLRRKFSRLEETMSRLKSQGAALGAIGGGGGMPGLIG